MEQKHLARRGALLTLLGGMLWGLSGTCGQFLMQNKGFVSTWIVPIRMICAGVLLFLICLLKEGKSLWRIWKQEFWGILIFGIFGVGASQFTYFTAIGVSNAGTATVLQYVGPVLVMLFLSVKNRKLPTKAELLAILLAVAGTFLIATHADFHAMALSPAALFWGLASAVALAVYTIQPTKMVSRWGVAAVAASGMIVGGVILCAVFRPWTYAVQVDFSVLGIMAVIILGGTVMAYTFYMEGVRCAGAKKGSLYACVEPVSAAIFSALWMGTSFVALDLVGFALILSTVFLLALDQG